VNKNYQIIVISFYRNIASENRSSHVSLRRVKFFDLFSTLKMNLVIAKIRRTFYENSLEKNRKFKCLYTPELF
jgi:hypothetical protein